MDKGGYNIDDAEKYALLIQFTFDAIYMICYARMKETFDWNCFHCISNTFEMIEEG